MRKKSVRVLSYFLGGFVGLIIAILFQSVLTALFCDFTGVITVLIFIFWILGITLGIISVKHKNFLYTVFKPSKWNILISILLGVLLHSALFLFFREETFVYAHNFLEVSNVPFAFAVSIVYSIISFYPFAALTYFSFVHKKEMNLSKIILLVTFFVILNPIMLVWSEIVIVKNNFNNLYEPCGVRIVQIADNSPLKNEVKTDEVITGMNGIKVNKFAEVADILNSLKNTHPIMIQINHRTVTVTPNFDSQTQKYKLGVSIDQEYCQK